MAIKISDFRGNIKGYFDEALNGSPVEIERGGVLYRLEVGTVIKNTPPVIKNETLKPVEKISEATPPLVSDLFSGENGCCNNEYKLCQHWVWDADSGEGYINSLSGRKMEVE